MSEAHDLQVAWLRVFRVVARRGSFTGAARELDYTQSAVSRQIAALEGEVGAPLFDRLARGVRLTESGRVLLHHAEAVLRRLDTATRDLSALHRLASGRLRVGAFATANAALLPAALSLMRRRYPGLDLTGEEGLSARLVRRLVGGDLDVAVVSSTAGDSLDGLRLHRVLDDAMYVALPRGHPLADRPRLGMAELADEEWIAGRASPEDTLLAAALRTGFRPRIAYVVAEWVAKQGFVAAGLGVTLVPSLAATTVRPDLALVPIDTDDIPPRSVYAATAGGVTPPPAAEPFLRALAESADGLHPRTAAEG